MRTLIASINPTGGEREACIGEENGVYDGNPNVGGAYPPPFDDYGVVIPRDRDEQDKTQKRSQQNENLRRQIDTRVNATVSYLTGLGSAGRLAAARIRQVWADIGSYTASSVYATISPIEAAAAIERNRFHLAHWLTALRNFLILMPLLMTWVALAWATMEYQQELARSPKDVNYPLLDLWQRGFTLTGPAGVSSTYSFSHVAWVDAGIFAALIIVGLVVDIMVTRARSVAKEAHTRLEEVTMLICHYCAELKLTESGFPDLRQWSDEIRGTIEVAAMTTQNATQSLEKMGELATNFQANVGVLERSAQSVANSANGLATAVSGVVTSAAEMKTAAEAAAEAQRRSADELDAVLARIEALATASGNTARDVRAMSENIVSSMSVTNRSLDRAARTMEDAALKLGGELPAEYRDDAADDRPGCLSFFGGGRASRRRDVAGAVRRPSAPPTRAGGAPTLAPPRAYSGPVSEPLPRPVLEDGWRDDSERRP